MVKRELPAEKDTIFYLYVTSLLVFAVSFTPDIRLILERSVESRTPLDEFFNLNFFKF